MLACMSCSDITLLLWLALGAMEYGMAGLAFTPGAAGNMSRLRPEAQGASLEDGGAGAGAEAENASVVPQVVALNVTLGMSIGEAVAFSVLLSICICATIVGNILVIMSVFTYRPLRGVQNFFIVSLAVADLAVAILVMPFNVANFVIGRWVFGAIFCNMWLTFDILTCTASILNLCAIAIDRYYAIHDPIRYAQKRTLKRVLITILLVWVVSILISVPPLIGWNNSGGSSLYNEVRQECMLTDAPGFVIYSASGSFFIPLFIMTFVYFNIFRATRKRLRARAKAAAAAKLRHSQNVLSKETPPSKLTEPSSSGGSPEDTPEHNAGEDTGQHMPNNNLVPTSPCYTNPKAKKLRLNLKVSTNSDYEESRKLTSPDGNCDNGSARGGSKRLEPPKSQMAQFLEERQRISLSKERRAARTMAIIMGAFVVCWLPFFLMYIIFPFCQSCVDMTDQRLVNFIVWLGYINSTLNPIIYTIFNIDFRRAFKNLLLGKCRT